MIGGDGILEELKLAGYTGLGGPVSIVSSEGFSLVVHVLPDQLISSVCSAEVCRSTGPSLHSCTALCLSIGIG